MPDILFLPGAIGAPEFWHAVGAKLPDEWKKTYLGWPGLGDQRHDPLVRGFEDLVALAEATLTGPIAVVAHSMGGVVAIRLALQHPTLITHLVLTATSGGIDTNALGALDWRADYRQRYPRSAPWILDYPPDLTAEIATIAIPTLLIWGDADPISPLAVGECLTSLLANSRLAVVAGGTHSLVVDRAIEVSAMIRDYFTV